MATANGLCLHAQAFQIAVRFDGDLERLRNILEPNPAKSVLLYWLFFNRHSKTSTIMDAALSQGLVIAGGIVTLGLSALGSALGTGAAGSAAVGAWKKCYAQGKMAPFTLLSFVGAPLTQTLYGMILMFVMFGEKVRQAPAAGIPCLVIGLFAGIGIGSSAIMQGRCAAAAADAQGETGKGFTNYLAAIGIIETVAIFTMVFALIGVVKFGA